MGLTNYFCPVSLKKYSILKAGNPEIAASYENHIYYFASEEDREIFLEKPDFILEKLKDGTFEVSHLKKTLRCLHIYIILKTKKYIT